MKLIGKIHDYYDGVLEYGVDDAIVFVRTTVQQPIAVHNNIIDILNNALGKISRWPSVEHSLTYDGISTIDAAHKYHYIYANVEIIGFCGKLYPGIRFKFKTIDSKEYAETFYPHNDYATLRATIEEFDQGFADNYFRRFRRYGKKIYSAFEMQCNAIDVLQEYTNTDWFVNMQAPYFRVTFIRDSIGRNSNHHGNVDSTPVLKDYNFFKVKDAYQAFQEISMYLGGVLPRQTPEIVNISDTDRIIQHGFDKLSFRNPCKPSQLNKLK